MPNQKNLVSCTNFDLDQDLTFLICLPFSCIVDVSPQSLESNIIILNSFDMTLKANYILKIKKLKWFNTQNNYIKF